MTERDPSKTSADYNAQADFWSMAEDITIGASAVRKAGEKYLPRFESEDAKEHKARVMGAPWTPLYSDSLRNLAAKPFSKEVRIEDGPEAIEALAENIDARGNHLHVFARECFKAAISTGIDWIWVGHTPVAEGSTVAEARAQGARAWWKRIPARRMLAVYSDTVGGTEILTHVRIDEKHSVRDGFGEKEVNQVRVIERPALEGGGYGPPEYTVWIKQKDQHGKDSWIEAESGPISTSVIPLVPVILGEREGSSWRVRAPLRDLAYMQITLYQKEANLSEVLKYTAFPVNVLVGVDKPQGGERIDLGPRSVIYVPPGEGNPGDFKREEPGGTAAKSLREDIAEHKREMREAGMQPLVPGSGTLTATATAVAEAKAHSAVQASALALKDALEQAFVLTGEWLGDTGPVTVFVHTDFAVGAQSAEEMRIVLEMADPDNRKISDAACIAEAQRRGILGPDFDPESDMRQILEEIPGDEPDPEEAGLITGNDPERVEAAA